MRGARASAVAVALVLTLLGCGTSHAEVATRSGLPWASGAGTVSWQQFEAWRGAPLDVWTTWNNAPTWSDMRLLWTVPQYNAPRFPGRMSFAQPLLDVNSSFAECTAGAYDEHFHAIATSLAGAGWGDAYVRLGWEMNATWYKWSAASDPAGFVGCFRRAADIFRAVSPAYRIEWNPAVGISTSPAVGLYPGDQWVDVVGVDIYDSYPASRDEATWAQNCGPGNAADPRGLCDYLAFAQAHGKKLSVPEWGVDSKPGNGGFDNPFFVQKMTDFFDRHADALAYEAYFDLMDPRFEISHGANPAAAAAYLAAVRQARSRTG